MNPAPPLIVPATMVDGGEAPPTALLDDTDAGERARMPPASNSRIVGAVRRADHGVGDRRRPPGPTITGILRHAAGDRREERRARPWLADPRRLVEAEAVVAERGEGTLAGRSEFEVDAPDLRAGPTTIPRVSLDALGQQHPGLGSRGDRNRDAERAGTLGVTVA